MNPLQHQNPWVILSYVNDHKLKSHPAFKWTNKYVSIVDHIANFLQDNKAQTKDAKSPKFKFGIKFQMMHIMLFILMKY